MPDHFHGHHHHGVSPLGSISHSNTSSVSSTPVPLEDKTPEELRRELTLLTKVNAELKALLVASMGSDLEERYESLLKEKVSCSIYLGFVY
eukprot:Awhi_evm1s12891